jgi:hypothetical protein
MLMLDASLKLGCAATVLILACALRVHALPQHIAADGVDIHGSQTASMDTQRNSHVGEPQAAGMQHIPWLLLCSHTPARGHALQTFRCLE